MPRVGILYDEKRVKLRAAGELSALRPTNEPCDADVHPGFGAHLSFGPNLDLHFVSIHLPAGRAPGGLARRKQSWRGVAESLKTLQRRHRDADIVLAGDFNTGGCDECEPVVTANTEIAGLSRHLEQQTPKLALLSPALKCTEYHDGRPWLFNHFAISAPLQPRLASPVRVSGFCAERRYGKDTGFGQAVAELSDHCPVVLELRR